MVLVLFRLAQYEFNANNSKCILSFTIAVSLYLRTITSSVPFNKANTKHPGTGTLLGSTIKISSNLTFYGN